MFVRVEFRAYDSNVISELFIVRVGEVDSTARFYQWKPDGTFSLDIRKTRTNFLGTFGGWLQGTGRNALGTKMLILQGGFNVVY